MQRFGFLRYLTPHCFEFLFNCTGSTADQPMCLHDFGGCACVCRLSLYPIALTMLLRFETMFSPFTPYRVIVFFIFVSWPSYFYCLLSPSAPTLYLRCGVLLYPDPVRLSHLGGDSNCQFGRDSLLGHSGRQTDRRASCAMLFVAQRPSSRADRDKTQRQPSRQANNRGESIKCFVPSLPRADLLPDFFAFSLAFCFLARWCPFKQWRSPS